MFAPRPLSLLFSSSFSHKLSNIPFHQLTLCLSFLLHLFMFFHFFLFFPFLAPLPHFLTFLNSHCYLDCMPQRRTKWLASFLCSLCAVNVMFVPPKGKKKKTHTENAGCVQIWSWDFSCLFFYPEKVIYIKKKKDLEFPSCKKKKLRNHCRCKRVSYWIGTEPVCVQIHLWITDLTEQRESLIVHSFFFVNFDISERLLYRVGWRHLELLCPLQIFSSV